MADRRRWSPESSTHKRREYERVEREEAPRMRSGAESLSSSSSSSSYLLDISRISPRVGLRAFFSGSPERRKLRKRRSNRVLRHSNSSSSSINSDLAYGNGYIKVPKPRRVRSRKGKEVDRERYREYNRETTTTTNREFERERERSDKGKERAGERRPTTDAEIIAVGAGLLKIARDQNKRDLKEARNGSGNGNGNGSGSQVNINQYSSYNQSSSYNNYGNGSRGLGPSRVSYEPEPVDDDGWESDDGSESSVDSRLAFHNDTGSGWFGFGKPTTYKPQSRKSTLVDPALFGPLNSLHGIVNEPVGHGEITNWTPSNDFGQGGPIPYGTGESVLPYYGPRPGPPESVVSMPYYDARSAPAGSTAESSRPPNYEQRGSFPPAPASTVSGYSQPPLQNVYPMPTNDPTRFDVARSSVVSGAEPYMSSRSRPDPVPIQQPQPFTPVSQSVYTSRSEPAVSKQSPPSSSRGKSLAEAALVGVAGAAIGAAIASEKGDRKEKRRDERERSELKRKDSEDSKDERRREKEREERRERRRKEGKKDSDSDERRERRRERRREEGREETKEERRERRREEKRTDRSEAGRSERSDYSSRRTKSDVSVSTTSVDPFQFQVPDDAFPTPTYASTPVHGRIASVPTVYTVDREPDFARTRTSSSPERPVSSRHDTDTRRDETEWDPIHQRYRRKDSPERPMHDAEAIYQETKHFTAPIEAAAVGAAIAAVTTAEFREARSDRDRRREERRGRTRSRSQDRPRSREPNRVDHESGSYKDVVVIEEKPQRERDPIQEEADRAYREIVMARKIASQVIRSRSPSPSVTNKYKNDDQEEVIRIVTPPGMEDRKKEGPYDAPNADFKLDYVIEHPRELRNFSIPITSPPGSANPYLKRDPDASLPRPHLNLVRPTPAPSPMPERQKEKTREKETHRSEPAKPVVETPRTQVSQVSQDAYENDPKRSTFSSPTSSTVSKGVTWGENDIKHYEVESPHEERKEYVSSSDIKPRDVTEPAEQPKSKPRSTSGMGWGAIVTGIVGAGAAAAATSSDTSKTSSKKDKKDKKENKEERDAPYEYRGVIVEPESPPRSKERSSPPTPTGPKPTSPQPSRIPGTFDDDMDYTPPPAASLSNIGFDPINDPALRSSSSQHGIYQAPYAETVTDLGVHASSSSDPSREPPQDFEVGGTPPRSTSPDEFTTKLSKKDQKKRDKAAKRQSADVTPITEETPITKGFVEDYFDTPKLSKKEQKKRDKAAGRSSSWATEDATPLEEPTPVSEEPLVTSREIVEEPESYFVETPKKSKKKSKKSSGNWDEEVDEVKSKKSKKDSTAWEDDVVDAYSNKLKKASSTLDNDPVESPRAERDISVPVDAFDDLRTNEDEWDEPKKSKKKSKRDSEQFDSPSRSVTSEVASPGLERSSSKKSKDKSKRKSEQYDPDPEPAEISLPPITASEFGGNMDHEDSRKSRRSSKRDSGEREESVAGSVVSADASRYGDDEHRKSKKKHRSSTRDDFDDTRSVASAPAGDDFEDSKKSKKKDKRSSGGFFGLFGSKSEPDKEESSKGARDEFEEVSKKSKKSKRHSTDALGLYEDTDSKYANESSRVSSNGNGHSNGSKAYDDDERSLHGDEKKSSRSRSGSTSSKKDSFLARAGTLGAGVGLAGAAVAIAAQHHQRSKADNVDSNEPAEPILSRGQLEQHEMVDPEITERQFRPSIDPQYGDLLPLPPSEATSPFVEPAENEDLPELPDSRPDTPEAERFARDRPASVRRSLQDSSTKSPSQSAVPLKFMMSNRSTPTSPKLLRGSPITSPESPLTPRAANLAFPREKPRPTSWDNSKEYKPLYLVESNRRTSVVQADEPEEPLPELPPSQRTSRSSSELEFQDAVEQQHWQEQFEKAGDSLSIDTSLNSHDLPDSQQSTPKALTFPRDLGHLGTPPKSDLPHQNLAKPSQLSPYITSKDHQKTSHSGDVALGAFAAAAAIAAVGYATTSDGHTAQDNDEDVFSDAQDSRATIDAPIEVSKDLPASEIASDNKEIELTPSHEADILAESTKDAEPSDDFPSTKSKKDKKKDNKKDKEASRTSTVDEVPIEEPKQDLPQEGLTAIPVENATFPAEPAGASTEMDHDLPRGQDDEEFSFSKPKKDKKKNKKGLSRSSIQEDLSIPVAVVVDSEDPVDATPVVDEEFEMAKNDRKKGLTDSWTQEDVVNTDLPIDKGAVDEAIVEAEPVEDFSFSTTKKDKKKNKKASRASTQDDFSPPELLGGETLVEETPIDAEPVEDFAVPLSKKDKKKKKGLSRSLTHDDFSTPDATPMDSPLDTPAETELADADPTEDYSFPPSKKDKRKKKGSSKALAQDDFAASDSPFDELSSQTLGEIEVIDSKPTEPELLENFSVPLSKKDKKKKKGASQSWAQDELPTELVQDAPQEAEIIPSSSEPTEDHSLAPAEGGLESSIPATQDIVTPSTHSKEIISEESAPVTTEPADEFLFSTSKKDKKKKKGLSRSSTQDDVSLPEPETEIQEPVPEPVVDKPVEDFSFGKSKKDKKKDKKKGMSVISWGTPEEEVSKVVAETPLDVVDSATKDVPLDVVEPPSQDAPIADEVSPIEALVQDEFDDQETKIPDTIEAPIVEAEEEFFSLKKSKKDKKGKKRDSRVSSTPDEVIPTNVPSSSELGDQDSKAAEIVSEPNAEPEEELFTSTKKSKKDKKSKKRDSIAPEPTDDSLMVDAPKDVSMEEAEPVSQAFEETPVEAVETATQDAPIPDDEWAPTAKKSKKKDKKGKAALIWDTPEEEVVSELSGEKALEAIDITPQSTPKLEDDWAPTVKKGKKKDKKTKSASSWDTPEVESVPQETEEKSLDATESTTQGEPLPDDEWSPTIKKAKKKDKKGKSSSSLDTETVDSNQNAQPETLSHDNSLESSTLPVPVSVEEPVVHSPEAPMLDSTRETPEESSIPEDFEAMVIKLKEKAEESPALESAAESSATIVSVDDQAEMKPVEDVLFVPDIKKGKKNKKDKSTASWDTVEDEQPSDSPVQTENENVDEFEASTSKKGKKNKKGKSTISWDAVEDKQPVETPAQTEIDVVDDFETPSSKKGKKNKKGKSAMSWDAVEDEQLIETPIQLEVESVDDFETPSSKKGKKKGKKSQSWASEEPILPEPAVDLSKEIDESVIASEAHVEAETESFSLPSSKKKKQKKSRLSQVWEPEPEPFAEITSQETPIEDVGEQSDVFATPMVDSVNTARDTTPNDPGSLAAGEKSLDTEPSSQSLQPDPETPSNYATPMGATPWTSTGDNPKSFTQGYFPSAAANRDLSDQAVPQKSDEQSYFPSTAHVLPLAAAGAAALGVGILEKNTTNHDDEAPLVSATSKSLEAVKTPDPQEKDVKPATPDGLTAGYDNTQLSLARQLQLEFASGSKKSKDKKKRQSLPSTPDSEFPRSRSVASITDSHERSRSLSIEPANGSDFTPGEARKSVYSEEQLEFARQLKADFESGKDSKKMSKKDKKKRQSYTPDPVYDEPISTEARDDKNELANPEPPVDDSTFVDGFTGSKKSKKDKKGKKGKNTASEPVEETLPVDEPAKDNVADLEDTSTTDLVDRSIAAPEDEFTPSKKSKKDKKGKKRESYAFEPTESLEPTDEPAKIETEDLQTAPSAPPDDDDFFTSTKKSKKDKKGKKRESVAFDTLIDDGPSEKPAHAENEDFKPEDPIDEPAFVPEDEFTSKKSKKDKKSKKRDSILAGAAAAAAIPALLLHDEKKPENLDSDTPDNFALPLDLEDEFTTKKSKKDNKEKKRDSLLRSITEDEAVTEVLGEEGETAPAPQVLDSEKTIVESEAIPESTHIEALAEPEPDPAPIDEWALPSKKSKKDKKNKNSSLKSTGTATPVEELSLEKEVEPAVQLEQVNVEPEIADEWATSAKKSKTDKKNKNSSLKSSGAATPIEDVTKEDPVAQFASQADLQTETQPEAELVDEWAMPSKKSKKDKKGKNASLKSSGTGTPIEEVPKADPKTEPLIQSESTEPQVEAEAGIVDEWAMPVKKSKDKKKKNSQLASSSFAITPDEPSEEIESKPLWQIIQDVSDDKPAPPSPAVNSEDTGFDFSTKKSKKDKKNKRQSFQQETSSAPLTQEDDLTEAVKAELPTDHGSALQAELAESTSREISNVQDTPTDKPNDSIIDVPADDMFGEPTFTSKKSKKDKKKRKDSAFPDIDAGSGSTTPSEPIQAADILLPAEPAQDQAAFEATNLEIDPVIPEITSKEVQEPEEEWGSYSLKKSKKDKKKGKSGISTPAEPEPFTELITEPSITESKVVDDPVEPAESADQNITIEDFHNELVAHLSEQPEDELALYSLKKSKKDKKKRQSQISTPVEETPPVIAQNDSKLVETVAPPVDKDLDFMATLAAGLEGTGFDPNIVIDDPSFRSASPRDAEKIIPDGDEWGQVSVKKSKRDKKRQKSGISTPIEKEISVIEPEAEKQPIEGPSSQSDKDLDFMATLAAGLQNTGFDPNLVIDDPSFRSPKESVPDQVEPEEEWGNFATKKSKKDKKEQKASNLTPTEQPSSPAVIETERDPKKDEVDSFFTPSEQPPLETSLESSVLPSESEPADDYFTLAKSSKKGKKDKKNRKSGLSTPLEQSLPFYTPGEGVNHVATQDDASTIFQEPFTAPAVLEKEIPVENEISRQEPVLEPDPATDTHMEPVPADDDTSGYEIGRKSSKKDKRKRQNRFDSTLNAAAEPAQAPLTTWAEQVDEAEVERKDPVIDDIADDKALAIIPSATAVLPVDDFIRPSKKGKKGKKRDSIPSEPSSAVEPDFPGITPLTIAALAGAAVVSQSSETPVKKLTKKEERKRKQTIIDKRGPSDDPFDDPVLWEGAEPPSFKEAEIVDNGEDSDGFWEQPREDGEHDVGEENIIEHKEAAVPVHDSYFPQVVVQPSATAHHDLQEPDQQPPADLPDEFTTASSKKDKKKKKQNRQWEAPQQEARKLSFEAPPPPASLQEPPPDFVASPPNRQFSFDTTSPTNREVLTTPGHEPHQNSRDLPLDDESPTLGRDTIKPASPYEHRGASHLPVVREESQSPPRHSARDVPDLPHPPIGDNHRDSAFISESPVPPAGGFPDEHQHVRDSGVHFREFSPAAEVRTPVASTDDALARLSWPTVDEDTETVDIHKSQRSKGTSSLKPQHHEDTHSHSSHGHKSIGNHIELEVKAPSHHDNVQIDIPKLRRDRSQSPVSHHNDKFTSHERRPSPLRQERSFSSQDLKKHYEEKSHNNRDLLPSQRHEEHHTDLHRTPTIHRSRSKGESLVKQRVQRIESPDSTRPSKEDKYADLHPSQRPRAERPTGISDNAVTAGAAILGASVGFAAARQSSREQRPGSVGSNRSTSNINRLRTPDYRPESAGSNRSGTPPLRRSDRKSGDLRSLSQQSKSDLAKEAELAATASALSSSNNTTNPTANEGRVRAKDMADVYDGFGEGRLGSPRSPTRPHSMRRRQSMQVLDLESRLELLAAENRALAEAKLNAERTLQDSQHTSSALVEKDAEIDGLKRTLDWLQNEVTRLSEVNDGLASANVTLGNQHNDRYGQLETKHAQTARELQEVRDAHNSLSGGMEGIVTNEVQNAVEEKDREIAQLKAELEAAKSKIREMQRQILATKSNDDDWLTIRDEDYFDMACQQLCQHVQQWVLRFSKFSDMRACRLTSEINNDKIIDRLDNAILDGSDVDTYLADRVKRRDVFMSMTMTMVWEFVFTRYLFGMDREQRQKLKALEKLLLEVGPPSAVHHWRATTLTLLSKRAAFREQREQDTIAVVNAVMETLTEILPPPSHLEDQIQEQLLRVMKAAVDLSIEMRTQRAEYMMLPPLQPEYDANGDLASKVSFNAALMNERSGESVSNEALEQQGATVRVVLFPLVVKKGDDSGDGDEEIVVCPAQVLVARPKAGKSVRMAGGNGSRVSMQSSMPAGDDSVV